MSYWDQLEWAIILLQTLSLGFVKLSILFFYRRIFHHGSRGFFDIFTKILAVFTLLWTISFFIAFVLSCGSHIDYIWGPYINILKYCNETQYADLAYTVLDMVVDMILLILPIPLVSTELTINNEAALMESRFCGFICL